MLKSKLKETLQSYLSEINLGSKNASNLKAALTRVKARSLLLLYTCVALLFAVFFASVYISLNLESSDAFTNVVTADAGFTFLLGLFIRYFYKEATGADYLLATIEGLGDVQITEIVKSIIENYFNSK